MPHDARTGPIRLDYDDSTKASSSGQRLERCESVAMAASTTGAFDAAAIVTAAPFAIVPTVEMVRPPAGERHERQGAGPDAAAWGAMQCNALCTTGLCREHHARYATGRYRHVAPKHRCGKRTNRHRAHGSARSRFPPGDGASVRSVRPHAQLNATITVLDRDASNPDPVVDTPAVRRDADANPDTQGRQQISQCRPGVPGKRHDVHRRDKRRVGRHGERPGRRDCQGRVLSQRFYAHRHRLLVALSADLAQRVRQAITHCRRRRTTTATGPQRRRRSRSRCSPTSHLPSR